MKTLTGSLLICMGMVFLTGCPAEPESTPDPEPAAVKTEPIVEPTGPIEDPQPDVFEFTDTNVVVTVEEIEKTRVPKRSTVKADFNMDGLKDMAVIMGNEDGGNEVALFIQRSGQQGTSEVGDYYRGGSISESFEGDIIGIGSRKGDGFIDLVVVIAREGSSPAMVHYRNNGSTFTKVKGKAAGARVSP